MAKVLKTDPNDCVSRFAEKNQNNKKEFGEDARLAFKRHLKDLKRQGTKNFPYIFNASEAQKIIDFANTLTIKDGHDDVAFKCVGFQEFILGSLFGWRNKDTNDRRFTESYVQLSRKQGKSILNGVICLWCSNFDGYRNGQIYCTATKQDQAKIIFDQICKFINADEDLAEYYDIRDYQSKATGLITNSVIKALGRDTKTIDGFEPYLGIVDEYHAHPNNQMYKQLKDGTANITDFLISVITTAGFNVNGPCKEQYDYCRRVLRGVDTNEEQFVYIAQMDKDDDIWNPKNWIKCCPFTGKDKAKLKKMKQDADKAKSMGGAELLNFLTKRLNIWVQSDAQSLLNIDDWLKNGSKRTLKDFEGKKAVCGLDLSSGGDLTSLTLEFVYQNEDEERKYYLYSHSFMPKARLQEHMNIEDNAPYSIWLKNGLITETTAAAGIKTDYKTIIEHLRALIDTYKIDLAAIAYDPHNASAFLADLEDFGVDLIEIKQSARSLNDATKDFQLEVQAGNMEYDHKNKLLTRSMNDAIISAPNSFGEIKIDKMTQKNRIDPCDAAICSHKVAMSLELDEFTSDDAVDAILDLI